MMDCHSGTGDKDEVSIRTRDVDRRIRTQNHNVSTATLGRFRGVDCCAKAALLRPFPESSKEGDGTWEDPWKLSRSEPGEIRPLAGRSGSTLFHSDMSILGEMRPE